MESIDTGAKYAATSNPRSHTHGKKQQFSKLCMAGVVVKRPRIIQLSIGADNLENVDVVYIAKYSQSVHMFMHTTSCQLPATKSIFASLKKLSASLTANCVDVQEWKVSIHGFSSQAKHSTNCLAKQMLPTTFLKHNMNHDKFKIWCNSF